MAETDAPQTPKAAAKPKAKKAAKPKKPSSHPKYSEMIQAAVVALKERGGSSRQAVLKYILAHYNVGKDGKIVNAHLKMALRAGVKNGSLKQSKGTGASGSFRLGETKAKKAIKVKKPKSAAKKPKAKKPKAKKPATEKKVKKAKSPKKAKAAKKPKAAKPKKAKSPKKAKAAKPKKAKSPKKAKK